MNDYIKYECIQCTSQGSKLDSLATPQLQPPAQWTGPAHFLLSTSPPRMCCIPVASPYIEPIYTSGSSLLPSSAAFLVALDFGSEGSAVLSKRVVTKLVMLPCSEISYNHAASIRSILIYLYFLTIL